MCQWTAGLETQQELHERDRSVPTGFTPNGVDLSSPSGPAGGSKTDRLQRQAPAPTAPPPFLLAFGEQKRGRGDDLAKLSGSSSKPVCGPPTRGRWSREIRCLFLGPRHWALRKLAGTRTRYGRAQAAPLAGLISGRAMYNSPSSV